jgi:hypothetical protein
MTLRTIESHWKLDLSQDYSALVMQEAKKKSSGYSLVPETPLFDIIHPALLKTLKELTLRPDLTPSPFVSPRHFATFYANAEEARLLTGSPVRLGQPWVMGEVILEDRLPLIIDFDPIGAVLFTATEPEKRSESEGIHQFLLPVWLNYAMSPELWSEQGKWPRFHRRLEQVFNQQGLLQGPARPGHYQLISEARKLENFGFFGRLDQDSYALTLPWSFPLSALTELEKVILQEF